MKITPQHLTRPTRHSGLPSDGSATEATAAPEAQTPSPPPRAPADSLERAPEKSLFALHTGAIPADAQLDSLQTKIGQLRSTAFALRSLADQALPTGLGADEIAAETAYSGWLARAADTLETAADGWQQNVALSDSSAPHQLQETQMSFNLQYLQLQSQMQHENRAYTAISNIMKTKHESAKNAIDNIR